jgi:hypothetical protein
MQTSGRLGAHLKEFGFYLIGTKQGAEWFCPFFSFFYLQFRNNTLAGTWRLSWEAITLEVRSNLGNFRFLSERGQDLN